MFVQFKRLTWKASLLATALSLLAFTIALAASGDLDTTFDGDGLVTSYVVPSNPGRSDAAAGVAIQANGKIVAAGYSEIPTTATMDFAITRYNTDGSLDTTFSGDGRLLTNFGGRDQAAAVAVQSNGKIVAAGQVCYAPSSIGTCDVALARYNANGTLDTTFSGDGKQVSDFGGGSNGSFGRLAIQSNGRIVVTGYMSNGSNTDFAVYRYLPGGSLDTTFSGDGKVNIGFGAGRQDFAADLVIQSDGKIVVAGSTGDAGYANNNFAIARLNANGSLDTTFSGDGRQITNFGANDYAYGVALQADGKIVVVGEKTTTFRSFALARYNTDGSLDTTFNGTGRRVFSITPGMDSHANDVIVQPDGMIVVIGTTKNGSGFFDFALARLLSTGGFDTTFSGDGKVIIDFGGNDYVLAIALQPLDGKYILGGATHDGTQYDFALARVLP
jgi:uncharacterized delta-60 repeat protein